MNYELNDLGELLPMASSTPQRHANLTPTPRRRNSNASEKSCNSTKSSNRVLVYDSGNYSTSSNASDAGGGLEQELQSNYERYQYMLREKDQALFLALQDVRKLRSELERLSKSEQWYKQELRVQKSTRLEALERLYAQERKYMQENQRLQRECVRLYERCGDMEKELETQRAKAVQQLARDTQQSAVLNASAAKDGSLFEFEQQRALIEDQQQLIEVLRKQKRALLEDLKRLSEEKDEKVLELQRTLAGMEMENTCMTAQCKRLLNERQAMEQTLLQKDNSLQERNAEKLKLQSNVNELREELRAQAQMLARKECEIRDLQQQFEANMKLETNMDEVHRMSVAHHEEINAKTAEILGLKKSLHALQEELDSLAELQTQKEQQERVIEQLNFTLETRQYELEHLKEADAEKAQQIATLQLSVEKMHAEREVALEQLQTTQSKLRGVEKELIALHEQYASMCALCERTRFELEMREIDQGKLKFQAESDKREIEQLRVRLRAYLKQTEELSTKMNQLEIELEYARAEKRVLQVNLKEVEQRLNNADEKIHMKISEQKEENETDMERNEAEVDVRKVLNNFEVVELKGNENYYLQELEKLHARLKRNEDTIAQLRQENIKLKQQEQVHTPYVSEMDVKAEDEDESGFLDGTEDMLVGSVTNNTMVGKLEQALAEQQQLLAELKAENAHLKALLQQPKTDCKTETATTRDFEVLNKEQTRLIEQLNAQDELFGEKEAILESLESLIDSGVPMIQDVCNNATVTVAMEKLVEENKKLKAQLFEAKQNEANQQLQQQFQEKSQECQNLAEKLQTQNNELQLLQRKLLASDAKLYKAEKAQQQMQENVEQKSEQKAEFKTLKREHETLNTELETAKIERKQLELALAQESERVRELSAQLYAVESGKINQHVDRETQTTGTVFTDEQQDVEGLKAKVQQLEAALQSSSSAHEARKEQRIQLIKQLLEQQNQKVSKLNETQAEWEELLHALEATQKLEENTRAELQTKTAELEELNALFAEQNEELRQLHEFGLYADYKRHEESEQAKSTFQEQLNVMQANYSDKLRECEAHECTIAELKRKNERLERNLNEDYASDVAENQKRLRTLQAKVERLQAERAQCLERMEEMENELDELRKSKRQAMLLPEFVTFATNTKCNEYHAGQQNDENENLAQTELGVCDDRMRILTKVLEAEYRRKMKRYDLHIRTLLGNVKSLKRALRAAEQRAAQLSEEQHKTVDDLRDMQVTKCHLEEMRLKFEQSQSTIKTLEQVLDIERKRFEASDLGKSTRSTAQMEPAHEVANLIDDYKKLIQQSAASTHRLKTSTILDLIQRSNQYVPNLNKLESNINGLRNDVDYFLAKYAQHNACDEQLKVPSLLDELRAATNDF